MFEADISNVDSLPSTNSFFGSGTVLILESREIASQHQCRQERPSLRFKGTAEFFSSGARGCIHLYWREDKSRYARHFCWTYFLATKVRATSRLKRFFWEKIGP